MRRGIYQIVVLAGLFGMVWGGVIAQETAARIPQNIVVALRDGPGRTYESQMQIGGPLAVTVLERTVLGNWVFIETENGDSGWVVTGYLDMDGVALSTIPVNDTVPDAAPEYVDSLTNDLLKTLYSTPILPEIKPAWGDLYQHGRLLGNNTHVIAKIGDCNTAADNFLSPIGNGVYNLGPYDHLANTIDAFAGTFTHNSVAARNGFNAASIFDPLWASVSADCEANETPLACEYRTQQPSVAFIMFGQNDILVLNREGYETRMREIIETLLDRGVIPVVSTFTNSPDNADHWGQILHFNVINIELAAEYDIPLINFWLAAQSLPAYGIGDDYAHLTQGGEGVNLDGAEAQYGLTLYNLVVLHVLDALYETVME